MAALSDHIPAKKDLQTVALTEKLFLEKPEKKKTDCYGRKITPCNCISQKTFFIIAAVVGAILLILGTLALIGYFTPASGSAVTALQKIKAAATFIASELGSDLFTLSMFTTSFGAAFFLTGVVGFCVDRYHRNSAKQQSEAPISDGIEI